MMKKRLVIARSLLKPDGVLIITIDRNEAQHLSLLLEELFPNVSLQPVTICINPSGSSGEGLSRVEEYAYFCFLGGTEPNLVSDDMLTEGLDKRTASIRWESLMRGGSAWYRKVRENLCYPVILNKDATRIIGVGPPMKFHDDPSRDAEEEEQRPSTLGGKPLAWPVRNDGKLGIWRVDGARLMSLVNDGFAYVSSKDEKRGTWTIRYLMKGTINALNEGKIVNDGRGSSGEALLRRIEGRRLVAKTVWNRGRHTAGGGAGTGLVSEILGRKDAFPFPKSLYAVRDCIDVAIGSRKNALIVDFFAGSGTTLNAVCLMNELDGGARRCVLITNNEIHPDERAKELLLAGSSPGEAEFEKHGICRAVTFPRCKYIINGKREDGSVIRGDYFSGKQLEQEKARNYTQIGFVDSAAIGSKKHSLKIRKQLASLVARLPQSLVDESSQFLISESHTSSILFDIAASEDWFAALDGQDHVTDLFIVTQDKQIFESLKGEVAELLGPFILAQEGKRAIAAGFPANLDYFRLDFLDRAQVETGGKLSDILSALWMMAGCRGKLPVCKGTEKMLFFKDCPFAVLVEESAIKAFLLELNNRPDIDWVFLITNDQDSFSRLCEWLPEKIPSMHRIHLWRNYVDNFLINVDQSAVVSP